MIKRIRRIWEFVSRLARVIAAIDDGLIETVAFWKWLIGDEPEQSNGKK